LRKCAVLTPDQHRMQPHLPAAVVQQEIRTMSRFRRVAAFRWHATAAAAASLLICGGGAAIAKDIKVCLIAGKTGPFEAYAKQTENGFMLGLEYLTKNTMKVGDDKLEILVKDDQLKPDRGKSLLEECYSDDKADIAVGTTGSPIALAMLPVAEEKKKVLIVEPAVADSITGDKWNRYIFRTGRSSYQDALANAAAMPASGDVSVGMLGL